MRFKINQQIHVLQSCQELAAFVPRNFPSSFFPSSLAFLCGEFGQNSQKFSTWNWPDFQKRPVRPGAFLKVCKKVAPVRDWILVKKVPLFQHLSGSWAFLKIWFCSGHMEALKIQPWGLSGTWAMPRRWVDPLHSGRGDLCSLKEQKQILSLAQEEVSITETPAEAWARYLGIGRKTLLLVSMATYHWKSPYWQLERRGSVWLGTCKQ